MNESISVEQKLRVVLGELVAAVEHPDSDQDTDFGAVLTQAREILASPNQDDDLIYTENCVCGAFFRDPYPRYHGKGCTGPQRLTWKEQARHYAEAAIARRNEHKRSSGVDFI